MSKKKTLTAIREELSPLVVLEEGVKHWKILLDGKDFLAIPASLGEKAIRLIFEHVQEAFVRGYYKREKEE